MFSSEGRAQFLTERKKRLEENRKNQLEKASQQKIKPVAAQSAAKKETPPLSANDQALIESLGQYVDQLIAHEEKTKLGFFTGIFLKPDTADQKEFFLNFLKNYRQYINKVNSRSLGSFLKLKVQLKHTDIDPDILQNVYALQEKIAATLDNLDVIRDAKAAAEAERQKALQIQQEAKANAEKLYRQKFADANATINNIVKTMEIAPEKRLAVECNKVKIFDHEIEKAKQEFKKAADKATSARTNLMLFVEPVTKTYTAEKIAQLQKLKEEALQATDAEYQAFLNLKSKERAKLIQSYQKASQYPDELIKQFNKSIDTQFHQNYYKREFIQNSMERLYLLSQRQRTQNSNDIYRKTLRDFLDCLNKWSHALDIEKIKRDDMQKLTNNEKILSRYLAQAERASVINEKSSVRKCVKTFSKMINDEEFYQAHVDLYLNFPQHRDDIFKTLFSLHGSLDGLKIFMKQLIKTNPLRLPDFICDMANSRCFATNQNQSYNLAYAIALFNQAECKAMMGKSHESIMNSFIKIAFDWDFTNDDQVKKANELKRTLDKQTNNQSAINNIANRINLRRKYGSEKLIEGLAEPAPSARRIKVSTTSLLDTDNAKLPPYPILEPIKLDINVQQENKVQFYHQPAALQTSNKSRFYHQQVTEQNQQINAPLPAFVKPLPSAEKQVLENRNNAEWEKILGSCYRVTPSAPPLSEMVIEKSAPEQAAATKVIAPAQAVNPAVAQKAAQSAKPVKTNVLTSIRAAASKKARVIEAAFARLFPAVPKTPIEAAPTKPAPTRTRQLLA